MLTIILYVISCLSAVVAVFMQLTGDMDRAIYHILWAILLTIITMREEHG